MLSRGIQRYFAAGFGVCVVGSALFLARRPETPPESTARRRDESVEARPAAVSPPSPSSAALEAPVTPQKENTKVAPIRAPLKVLLPAAAPDTLAEELALLNRAASQLSSGQASNALLALEEHQRRFSHGVLSAERNIAKARALCMLHRFDEGRAALARLATGTPSAARVKEECDSVWARASAADSSQRGRK
jgi:hypothetical protein